MKLIGDLNNRLIQNPSIFRIEILERFYEILEKKELVFVRPTEWDDPLENIVFNARIIKDGANYEHPIKQKIYGQCWSYEGDSYASWQIYTTKPDNKGISKRHFGIRLTTNISKLNSISNLNQGNFSFGLVQYYWKKDLNKLPKDVKLLQKLRLANLNEWHLRTLLIKRKSYSYEKEIRLLAVPNKKYIDSKDSKLCRLKIDPLYFFSSLRFDPAFDYKEFKARKEELVKKYYFKPKQITMSTLRRANNLKFNFDDV